MKKKIFDNRKLQFNIKISSKPSHQSSGLSAISLTKFSSSEILSSLWMSTAFDGSGGQLNLNSSLRAKTCCQLNPTLSINAWFISKICLCSPTMLNYWRSLKEWRELYQISNHHRGSLIGLRMHQTDEVPEMASNLLQILITNLNGQFQSLSTYVGKNLFDVGWNLWKVLFFNVQRFNVCITMPNPMIPANMLQIQ